MKAAVVTSFGKPPRYGDFPDPAAAGDHEIVVDVLAAGLHPIVRARASGAHYSSAGTLPLVPGIDGVGRDPEGQLRYFMLPGPGPGAMAERAVIDSRRSVVLPPSADPVAVAAAVNPVMSSWLALKFRTRFAAGQDVLVIGATGSAGQMAVAVSRLLGAGTVIAAGRNPARLAAAGDLGASVTVSLAGTPDQAASRLAAAAADVDVVLDYIWGEPAAAAMGAIITARADTAKPLTWVNIGSMAGATAAVPADALRSSRLDIVGSGLGSVTPAERAAAMPDLTAAIASGALRVPVRPVPLADVEQAWTEDSAERIVLLPFSS